ncbi:type II toxin-antitoxin system RelE family toxin [Adlercreutzia equolifaciens]|uniref:type II toxin-antitoxin system RelE family toxin n=1 Tax=Adlercreutzia equolifaciens TaxID=446660 RepID=UPI003AF176F6
MAYRVELTNRAKRQLASLDKRALMLVGNLIDQLDGCDDPRKHPAAKKLQGVESGWRWRCGTYRVLGTVDDGRVVIEIFRVGHRRDVYRRL